LSYLYSVFRLLSRGLHTQRCQVRYTDTKRLLKRMFIHPFFHWLMALLILLFGIIILLRWINTSVV